MAVYICVSSLLRLSLLGTLYLAELCYYQSSPGNTEPCRTWSFASILVVTTLGARCLVFLRLPFYEKAFPIGDPTHSATGFNRRDDD
jgi:hypothetical protein